MGFPGTWMTESKTTVYRVVPKCACSTIGQILYYSDHGHFYEGDIHDADEGLIKWSQEDRRDEISDSVRSHNVYTFSCVRNPYSRVLSSFFDKICGIQRNGKKYRGNLIPNLAQTYGIETEGDFDQIASFRRFLLFARDTIKFRKPMDPDIHWSAMSGHAATLVVNGGRYDAIFPTENFKSGMQNILNHIDTPHQVDLDAVPRFNESEGHGPKMAHPIEDYFDDLSRHLVYEIYKLDFDIFGYDSENPANKAPVRDMDLDLVHRMLGD
ncbi:MAG: sulfotransferase family protein [Pseudomonadota bacterium]